MLSFGGAGLLGLSLSGLLCAEAEKPRKTKAKGAVAHSVLPTSPTSSSTGSPTSSALGGMIQRDVPPELRKTSS